MNTTQNQNEIQKLKKRILVKDITSILLVFILAIIMTWCYKRWHEGALIIYNTNVIETCHGMITNNISIDSIYPPP